MAPIRVDDARATDSEQANVADDMSTGDPPEIPKDRPATSEQRTAVVKDVARWLGRFGGTLGKIAGAAYWLYQYDAQITASLDPPKSLEELQRAVATPRVGYEIHHIVEQTSAEQDGYQRSLIDGQENLVRIPDPEAPGDHGRGIRRRMIDSMVLAPREYLRGKTWEERTEVGLGVLVEPRGTKAMKPVSFENMSVDELVERFSMLAVEQDGARREENIRGVNQLYDALKDVEGELRLRDGDQRRALLRLYDHKNSQVRLKAAEATLAVAPDAARHMLQALADSREYPQSADARSAIRYLEKGIYKPK